MKLNIENTDKINTISITPKNSIYSRKVPPGYKVEFHNQDEIKLTIDNEPLTKSELFVLEQIKI